MAKKKTKKKAAKKKTRKYAKRSAGLTIKLGRPPKVTLPKNVHDIFEHCKKALEEHCPEPWVHELSLNSRGPDQSRITQIWRSKEDPGWDYRQGEEG